MAQTQTIGTAGEGRRAGTPQGVILTLIATLSVMGILVIAPILPRLQEHYRDVPNIAILAPIIMTVPALCVALFSPLAGYFADRYGRRKLLFFAIALYAPFGVAPLFLENIWAILATRVGVGITEAFIMTVSTAMIGDYYEDREREKWLAAQVGCCSIAAVVLLFGSGLLGSIHWRAPFASYGLALAILAVAAVLLFEPNRRAAIATARTTPLPWSFLAGICGVTLIAAVIFFIIPVQAGFILRAQGIREPATIGTIAAIGAMTVPLGSLVYHRMARSRISVLLALGFGLAGIGLTVIANTNTLATTLPGILINQLGCGLLLPSLLAYTMSRLPAEHRGRGIGIWTGTFFIGQFISPIIIGAGGAAVGGLLPAIGLMGVLGLISAAVATVVALRPAAAAPSLNA